MNLNGKRAFMMRQFHVSPLFQLYIAVLKQRVGWLVLEGRKRVK